MRHERFRERLDRLDNREAEPLALREHRAACPDCDRLASRVGSALAAAQDGPPPGARAAWEADSASPRADPAAIRAARIETRVMARVRLLPHPRREVSTRQWVGVGLLLALVLALIPRESSFALAKELLGSGYALPLALVMGLVFAAYGALFIGTHLDELGPLARRIEDFGEALATGARR